MKALVVNALARPLEDIDIATPVGRDVLIDVRASGLCHTDLLFATTTSFRCLRCWATRFRESLLDVGRDVTQFRTGDHVVGSLAQSCGSCARCQSGSSFQCVHPESTLCRPTDPPRLSRNGVGLFQGLGLGGFAERALIHENQPPLPKEMPFAQAGCSAAAS